MDPVVAEILELDQEVLTPNQEADKAAHQKAVAFRFGGVMPSGNPLAIQKPIDPLEELANRARGPVPRLEEDDPPRNDEPELLEAWSLGYRAGINGNAAEPQMAGALLQEYRRAHAAGTKEAMRAFGPCGLPAPIIVQARKKGNVASEVDLATIKNIAKTCLPFGGSLTYKQAEKKFKLRDANGMTAWRICQKYKKLTGKK